ncbi:MAG: ribonuclease HII [Myxococcales bacterium]
MGEEPKLSLAALRARLRDGTRWPPGALEALEHDPRAGAAELRRLLVERRRKERAETQRLHRMLAPERAARAEGAAVIAGVDEAGMAPLAGPVVAAAAILPEELRPRELDDSKKLDPETRERLAAEVKTGAVAWAVGLATVEEIDRLNIYHAGLLAMRRAVEGLAVRPDVLLVDARQIPGVGMPQRPIVHGDALSLSIAAASVLAKTHRDALMRELDGRYPGYGLSQHKGYPTPDHLEALARLGASAIHRRTFGPVRAALGLEPVQQELF